MPLLEVIEKENVYLTEDWRVETQPPSGESPSISLGQSFYDFVNLFDEGEFEFEYSKVEEFSLEDLKKLEFGYKKTELLTLEEVKFLKLLLTKKEELGIKELKKLKFIMLKTEPVITLVDSFYIDNKQRYYNWFFHKPLNENFTFKFDNNIDGLANDLEVENGAYSIVKEDYRPHVQKLELSSGRAKLIVDVPNFLRSANSFFLYFNVKMESGRVDVDVNIYYDEIKLGRVWHQHFIAGENGYNWIERCLKFLTYEIPYFNKIKIEFYGTSSFYIDNVLITKDRGFLRNPETFEIKDTNDVIEIENLISEKSLYFVYRGKRSDGAKLYWSVINRKSLLFLKQLFNKYVLFRTHDRKLIVGKIIGMDVEYIKRTRQPIISLTLSILTI